MFKIFKKNERGFTLIELLTVIAIIGLLSTLSVISLSVAKTRAKISNAQHDIDQIFKAITFLQNDTGQWPGHQVFNQSCNHLPGGCPDTNEICGPDVNGNDCANSLADDFSGLLANHSTPYPNWNGPYLKIQLLEDPWGNEYFFDTDYMVDIDNKPCGCDGPPCYPTAAIGSYGPDGLGVPRGVDEPIGFAGVDGAYSCDDVILIIGR